MRPSNPHLRYPLSLTIESDDLFRLSPGKARGASKATIAVVAVLTLFASLAFFVRRETCG